MTHKEICEAIMAKKTDDGRKAIRVANATILNVNLTDKERSDGNGTRVQMSITLDKECEGYRLDESTGDYVPSKTRVVFPSYLGLVSMLRANEDASPMVDFLIENDAAMKIILNHSKVTIIQEPVAEGEQYINKWTTVANPEPYSVNNDSWFAHIESIELSSKAKELLTTMVLRTLGL